MYEGYGRKVHGGYDRETNPMAKSVTNGRGGARGADWIQVVEESFVINV